MNSELFLRILCMNENEEIFFGGEVLVANELIILTKLEVVLSETLIYGYIFEHTHTHTYAHP